MAGSDTGWAVIETSRTLLILIVAAACRPRADASATGSLPRIGIAVSDSALRWCAELAADSAAPPIAAGDPVTIVFGSEAAVPAVRAVVRGARAAECSTAFPQPRWADYTAYDLEVRDSASSLANRLPTVALLIMNDAPWTRDGSGQSRADLDADGQPEEVRRCTADEGEHLSLWSRLPDGGFVRRWHEYFDWGGFTDPTCKPGEDGRDSTAAPNSPSRP